MQDSNSIKKQRSSVRSRANAVKSLRCKNLIAVLEEPSDYKNVGTVIRNVSALGVEKTYVVDSRSLLPADWNDMRERKSLSATSASAIKWSFVRTFKSTEECLAHHRRKGFVSMVTSPHLKHKKNVILHEADYTAPAKLAIWFGNESRGLSDTAVDASTACINIPMYGLVESLNLGTTTGIVLYEVTKQRREYQSKYKRAGKRRPIRRKPE